MNVINKKNIFRFSCLGFIIFLAVLLVRAYFVPHMTQKRLTANQAAFKKLGMYDTPRLVENLRQAIRIQTVSGGKLLEDPRTFAKSIQTFRRFLRKTYPVFFNSLEEIKLDSPSYLLKWPGQDSSLGAVGFMAHMDVVPVEPGTKGDWAMPPFSGELKDGAIWGRGALDDKSSLIAMIEATEALLQKGFTPPRDIYFIFGHDEEVGGNKGAKIAAQWFKEKGLGLDYILDEGSGIIKGDLLGTSRDVALISVAEKGVISLKLEVLSEGGHASMPPLKTPISVLASALLKLQQKPFPARFTDIHTDILQTLALGKPLLERVFLSNLWLFRSIVVGQMLARPPTAAQLRTTVAPTILKAGSKENVLPQSSSAVLNVRIHPNETVESVIDEIRKKIGDDQVTISKYSTGFDPPKKSAKNTPAFQRIQTHLQTVTGGVLVSPSITIASTDSKHFNHIAKNIYRILPMTLGKADVKTIHGTGEKISVKELKRMVRFYQLLLQQPE